MLANSTGVRVINSHVFPIGSEIDTLLPVHQKHEWGVPFHQFEVVQLMHPERAASLSEYRTAHRPQNAIWGTLPGSNPVSAGVSRPTEWLVTFTCITNEAN